MSIPLFSSFDDVVLSRHTDADESRALNTSRQAFLEAVAEVESAAGTERETVEQRRLPGTQAEAAQAALEESEARYVDGLVDYLSVLTALNACRAPNARFFRLSDRPFLHSFGSTRP